MNPQVSRPISATCLLLVATISISGCGIDPYVDPSVPRPGLVPSEQTSQELAKSPYKFQSNSTNLATSYVSIGSARAYAQLVQDAYQSALERRSVIRTSVNLASLGGALATLGLGISGGEKSATLITGLVTTALGISGQLLLTKDHEAAYSMGAKAVGCVVTAATNARPRSLPLLGVETATLRLENSTANYRLAVLAADQIARELEEIPTEHKNRMQLARRRLDLADYNLDYARKFLQSANILGEQLVNKVEEIRWAVNDAVRRAEPDVLVLDQGLRTIVSSRLGGLGVPLPKNAAAGAENTQVDKLGNMSSKFANSDLESAWIAAENVGDDVDADFKVLEKTLESASGETISFPSDVFSGCPLSAIDNITGPGPLSLNPSTAQIPAGQAGTKSTTISGPIPYYVLSNGLSQAPELHGSQLTVRVTKEEATAGRTISTEVRNFFGGSTIFDITVAGTANADEVTEKPPVESRLLTSPRVAQVQEKLGLSVDQKMGENTRKKIIEDLRDQQAATILAQLKDQGLLPDKCKPHLEAFGQLLGAVPADNAALTTALNGIYSEADYASKDKVDQDEVILDYYVDCEFL